MRVIDCKHWLQWRHQQILYCTIRSINVELVHVKKNLSLVFSGSRKSQPLRSTVQWETRHASFTSGMVGTLVGIFLSPLNSNDGFCLFHITVPSGGKDKNEQPHVGRTSIDVTIMLKWRHHVAPHQFQDFLEVFFMVFQCQMRYLVVSKKKNPLIVWGWDRKICPSRTTQKSTQLHSGLHYLS